LSETTQIRMTLIPEPAPNSRIVHETADDVAWEGPMMVGPGRRGAVEYTCGQCATVLIAGFAPGQVRNVVFRCTECRAFNDIPSD
jgi:hypothetical protein